jgi:class 3 adenylate cyclase
MASNSKLKVFLAGRVALESDGVVLDEAYFPGRQGRLLFAYLVAEQGRPVPRDELADALWREAPPATSDKALSVLASKLRGLLAEVGVDGTKALTSAFGAYRLNLPAGTWVDVIAAADALRDAEASLAADDLDRAKAVATQAASLARPTFLPGEEGAWVDGKRRELTDILRRALSCLAEACLRSGDAAEAANWAEETIALEPYRETGYRQLMTAHAAAGNRAEALRVYEQCRQLLATELGAYPSPETESVYRELLEQPTSEPSAATPQTMPAQLLDRDPLGSEAPVPTAAPRSKARATRERDASGAVEALASREERKVVTVLFADLVEFTATAERLDPEDVRAFLMPYYAHIRSELERFGGRVEKFIGDAVMALFGAPESHEDDPERAVRAALAIRDWLAQQGGPQKVRIAVGTGEAHVTLGARASEGEPVAVGDVVNTAARLQAAAPVNGILVGEQTFRATRYAIEYREAEPVAAKGKREPQRVWEAVRALAQPGVDLSRHLSPFVGRERELAVLRERLSWAASQRSAQLVTILGVPGIGKTRLLSELQQAAALTDESLTWRQGRSLPYGDGVTFWALKEIVKAEAGVLERDSAEKVERKLANAVEQVTDDPGEAERILTSLGVLLGLGGEESTAGDRAEAFAAWRDFVGALADRRPLVLAFEDLHWADEGLLDFVDELVDRVSDVPLLVVATARPELLRRRSGWAGGKPNAVTISLSPLSDSETARLITTLLEQPVGHAEPQAALLARVGGNPLYAEQFCRMLLERGDLDELPETVQGIIAARIDALAHEQKQLLQDAAVVGKVFWAGALEAIAGISRLRAEELLYTLERSEFVQRARRSSVAGDIEYAFRHVLLRDVAYGQIPRGGRAERHRLAAEWFESLGRPEDHAELLAHHYLAALEYAGAAGEDIAILAELAAQALHRAGLRAIRLSANERAVEHFSRAIAVMGQLPETDKRSSKEAELQLQLGVALFARRGLGAPEVERAYTRATELMMGSAPVAEQFPAHFGLSIYHGHRGNFGVSVRLVERLTKLASEGDDAMKLQALHARWMNSLFSGRIEDAVAAADAGRAIYRPETHHSLSYLYGNHDPCVCALALEALAFALRGESVQAVSQMHEAIALGEALGHAATLAQPLTQLPWAHQINGDAGEALLASEQALAFEDEVIHPQFFGIAHAMRGWALSRMGRDKEGIAELETAFADELRASHIWAGMIGGFLAEVHLGQGRHDAARALLDQMRSLTGSMGTYFFEPELLRIEAEWLRLAGQEADARRLLLQSIEIARQHGSWALAVRSGLALQRPLSAEHETDLNLLEELCERLPPDNDTDYGREARTLLGQDVTSPVQPGP